MSACYQVFKLRSEINKLGFRPNLAPAIQTPSLCLPVTHGVLLTLSPLRRRRLLIAPNAIADITILFVYVYIFVTGEDKVIWS